MRSRNRLVLCIIMVIFSLTACDMFKSDDTAYKIQNRSTIAKVETTSTSNTLVIGSRAFEGNFSPFFAAVRPDTRVNDVVFSKVCVLNENSELISNAGSIKAEEVRNDKDQIEQMLYTVKLNQDMRFSDGKPVTIDDLMFTYYVYGDSKYDGPSTFASLDIVGLKEYYYDSAEYGTRIEKLMEDSKNLSEYDLDKTITAYTDSEIEKSGPDMVNDAYSLNIETNTSDFKEKVREAFLELNRNNEDDFIELAQKEKYEQLKKSYINKNLTDGIDIPEIEGIKRVNDYTCTVLVNGVNMNAERLLGLQSIMPKHYYGVSDDGAQFSKGNMMMIKDKSDAPLGSGPFVFEKYENEQVMLRANADYFKGMPKFEKLEMKTVAEASKVDALLRGEIDIADLTGSKEVLDKVQENDITYSLNDNNGFGYIAVSAKKVPDINVRKGLMHLINRQRAVESFFGESASILERPISKVVAEYPKESKEYYGFDVSAAKRYFKQAGYKKDSDGILRNESGDTIALTVGISDYAGHPSAAILDEMKSELKKLGGDLTIVDIPSEELFAHITNGELDLWVAAWGAFADCDLSPFYHSSQVYEGGLNLVNMESQELDELLTECALTPDIAKRRELLSKELDIIMDYAVCMPVYQKKNMVIYQRDVINMDTVIQSDNPNYGYLNGIENIVLN